ncbi:MAG: radical SAM protein [Acidobacteriaceae bacterium]|nr:radical SAM protein [Acidobacteriaceae bacterium]
MWTVRETTAKSILTPVTGFLKEAGFTHSLTPARNCTYGCLYCYVPTMRLFGGLQREDWTHWGQFTTLKTNAAELLTRSRHAGQVIYCSPLVDPYQPTERERPLMPDILQELIRRPPAVFVFQTRGPLILRDIDLVRELAQASTVRISFSITTDRDDVRRRYEPHCESNQVRLRAIRQLRDAGLEVYATLAPLLPCNPEALAQLAIEASGRDLIGDPLHIRPTKAHGATTRETAFEVARRYGEEKWLEPQFQIEIVESITRRAKAAGLDFSVGPAGFGRLARLR